MSDRLYRFPLIFSAAPASTPPDHEVVRGRMGKKSNVGRKFRLTTALAVLLAILPAVGCQSDSPYIKKSGWNPFAKNDAVPSGRRETTVARAQVGEPQDYSSNQLVYGSSGATNSATNTATNALAPNSASAPPIKSASASDSVAPLPTLPGLPTLNDPPVSVTATTPAVSAVSPAPGHFQNNAAPITPTPTAPSAAPITPSTEITLPPSASEFPEFAKNAYDALENVETQEEASNAGNAKAVPPRERESLADREKAEKELEAKYRAWLAEQKAAAKEKSKTPRYLQPLSNDRDIFENPESPFARQMQQESESEHKFVRQITAADLNMMSDVSSATELMDWEKDQEEGIDWSKYSGKALYSKWRDFIGMGVNEKEALAVMRKACLAQMEYDKDQDPKKLKEAASLYEKAAKKWPDSLLEEDALFYAGECHFFRKDYLKAKTFYKQLVTKYSNSTLKKDASERLYYLGCYWVQCAEQDPTLVRLQGGERPRFSDFAGAKDAFQTIFMNDVSDRGRAPDALFALANAYMRRGVEQGDESFHSASRYYQQLYEFYPACDHVDKAYQLAMLALYMSYRGPLYDSTPLKKAEEIAEAATKARRGDREVIAEQLRLIHEEQARYLFVRGEYYEQKRVYAAARNYYNRLANEYPNSPLAEQAVVRYEKIQNYPAESDQFALIRPVVPFLPKSKNVYYEDRPGTAIAAATRNGTSASGSGPSAAERSATLTAERSEAKSTENEQSPPDSGGRY